MVVRQTSFRIGVLLYLLLYAVWGGTAYAHNECLSVEGGLGEQQEGQHVHAGQVATEPEEAGLTKALTTRNPRRSDIPDYLLVIMLAFIGIVVISRRSVSSRQQELSPEGRVDSENKRGDGVGKLT